MLKIDLRDWYNTPMAKIVNRCIEQLLKDVRFAPTKRKLQQLSSAEQFLEAVERDKSYPFDFVCYKITKFRSQDEMLANEVIDGESLYTDLLRFVLNLSSQIAEPVQHCGEKVYTVMELSEKFNVSRKTIDRWRSQGLVSRTYIFEDSKRRVGIRESSMRNFISKHPEMFKRAVAFNRMNEEEKRQIIELAIEMAQQQPRCRHEIIEEIAKKVSRAPETVRYTLENYEKANGAGSIFSKPFGVIDPETAVKIQSSFAMGETVEQLAKKYNRSVSSIYRILNQVKAREIKNTEIRYVYLPDFDQRARVNSILAEKIDFHTDPVQGIVSSKHDMTEYLDIINSMPMLNAEQEKAAFTKYNCLKYLASKIKEKISISCPNASYIKQFEAYMSEAERIKNIIIESNLRLVVNTAMRYANRGYSFCDLISEGNLALFRAVEKFNCDFAHRFANFAGLYIQKVFAARLTEEWRRKDKPKGIDMAGLAVTPASNPFKKLQDFEKKSHNLEAVINDNLTRTESYIIRNHYGITGTLLPQKPKTTKKIAEELGISKDKVKLNELKALQKLRHFLSKEEFELFEK